MQASLVWDLAGSGTAPSPATDGGGTWQQGSTTFFNVGPGGPKTWDNAQNFDVTFGSGGAGGIVTLGSAIRTGGNLIFGPTTAPYTIRQPAPITSRSSAASSTAPTPPINVATLVLAPTGTGTSASPIELPVFVSSGVTLTESGNITQAGVFTGLTKSGGGTLVLNDASVNLHRRHHDLGRHHQARQRQRPAHGRRRQRQHRLRRRLPHRARRHP